MHIFDEMKTIKILLKFLPSLLALYHNANLLYFLFAFKVYKRTFCVKKLYIFKAII